MLHIEILPVLQDNYVYLVHDAASGATAAVDPAVSEPVLERLRAKGWRLDYVWDTHHHADHVDGNLALQAHTGCRVAAARDDDGRIPGMDTPLAEGDVLQLGGTAVQVLSVPGHTRAHLAYWLPQAKALFCGDTLFSLGCGRLFEGSAAQMWASLRKLAALPDDTLVYCAHEYTEANGRFALTVEPGNPALAERLREVAARRAQGLPSVPSTMAQERACNPFLRTHSAEIRARLGMAEAEDVAVFAELRRRKDGFRG